MDRIELMNRNYVILKTKLSLVTAVTVGCILGLLKIKLWLIWGASDIHDTPLRICCLPLPAWVAADHRKIIALGGLSFGTGVLTFVLNFIPNVGSLIAMALPIPVIMVDQELSFAQYSAALLLPVLVQGYVGNVLEPQVGSPRLAGGVSSCPSHNP
jgi:predicted PurR-regulated permease PerM